MTRILLSSLCLSTISGLSQEFNKKDKTESPYFKVISDIGDTDPLPLKNTSAEVNIVGVIADVTITQEYKNEGKNALEAIYTFPISSNAAVYAMEMMVGDRKIVAKIEEKNKAREQYNKAKSEGKRTSLLEQSRPNVFQMNVANIMPGDDIRVILRYTEILVPVKGVYEFIYPTVVGPRYSEHKSANDEFVNTPYLTSGTPSPYNFEIAVNISAGMPIQNINCKTHKIDINYLNSAMAEVFLDPSENKGGNRDFVLQYKLSGDKIQSGLLLYEHEDENFFLLMVQPPKRVIKEEIPPREYIFIVDVSGSMRGFPISVSKKLMRNLIVNLRPTDRFNVMVFAGTSGWMSDESVPATLSNIERANKFIDNQRGGGGTNLLSALNKALTFSRHDESLSRSFVVVTDGYISVEKEVFDLIRKNNNNANLFAFGIGSGVNRFLIEGISHAGMSEPLIVLNANEAEAEAEKFRNYINYPVLTNIKSIFSGFEAYSIEPISLPDLFAERPVILFGKYKGEPKGNITIKGTSGNGRYKRTFDVRQVSPDSKNSALRYLWARKRIQMLDDYNKVSHSDKRAKDVTDLGLRYNLMTAYTSFIAIEEEMVANEGWVTTVKQPLPLPQGVPNSAVGFEMEIEEENFSFFFHKDLVLLTDFPKADEVAIKHKIESQLIISLNLCFCKYISLIDEIEITIDEQGKVKTVKIEGENISAKMRNEIIQCVYNENFISYNISKDWKFKITF